MAIFNPWLGAYYGNSNPYSSLQNTNYQMQQVQTPMPQMSQQSFFPQSNIIWVDSLDEVNRHPTGRGWQQLFGDKNKNIFYVRETDANGVTQPIKTLYYTYEEPEKEKMEIDSDTVTKEEFEKLASVVNSIADKLSDLLK